MARGDALPPMGRSKLSVSAAVVAVYAAAIVVLVLTGTTDVRYSADQAGTVPIWSAAVPAIIAGIVARLVPPRPVPAERGAPADASRTQRDAIVLAGLGLTFTVSLVAAAGSDLVFLAGKLSLLNAVVEEVFYRVWLQTRLEHLLGRWPAIGIASLLWASWHIAIQGTGRPVVDLAVVTVRLGVTGLFLGYLWSRYRVRWPLFVVHGAVNAPPALLAGALPWT